MKKILTIMLIIVAVFSYAIVYADGINEVLSSSILRLHIIAATESEADNLIKLNVRDYISENLAETKLAPYSREYTDECERLANVRLKELNCGYTATAKLERVYIPKKSYKGLTLPSGQYNAIRIVLGEGVGQNWWCVAYPALCFSEEMKGALSEEGKNKLIEVIPKDIYEVITDETEYRFFIVDLIGKILEKTT